MSTFTRIFLKNLTTKAQKLHPVVRIGVNGLTDSVHKEIAAALLAHELIKIHLHAASRPLKQTMAKAIADYHQAKIIQQIGHRLVIYKANTD